MDLTIKTFTGQEVITDHDSNSYTTEQLLVIEKLAMRDNFAYFVGGSISSTSGPPRREGPFHVLYYDKSAHIHNVRIGTDGRIFKEISTAGKVYHGVKKIGRKLYSANRAQCGAEITPDDIAEEIVTCPQCNALQHIEELEAMPIYGNHMQDSPAFDKAHTILHSGAPMDIKIRAIQRVEEMTTAEPKTMTEEEVQEYIDITKNDDNG